MLHGEHSSLTLNFAQGIHASIRVLAMKTIALLDALRAHYIPELLKRNDIGEGLFGEPLLLHNDRGDRFIGDTGTIAIAVTVVLN